MKYLSVAKTGKADLKEPEALAYVDEALGKGTAAEALLAEAREWFLALAFDSMKDTVDAIAKAGLRDKVKIMIGGGQIDDHVTKYTGADAYGKDAMETVNLTKGWIGG